MRLHDAHLIDVRARRPRASGAMFFSGQRAATLRTVNDAESPVKDGTART